MDDDQAKYAALEAEMSQPDPDIEGSQGIAIERERPEREQYDSARHGVPEQQQQQQQQPAYQVPDQNDDPIGHFDARMADVERAAVNQHQQSVEQRFWDAVVRSEEDARKEAGDDYDQGAEFLENSRRAELAQIFPDNSQESMLLARHNGYRTIADFREAQLNRDRIAVAQYALQAGVSPAIAYFRLACERGYRPQCTITRTQQKQLQHAFEHAPNDEAADKIWDWYRKASLMAEENRRS